jgi:hypothetical protein
VIVDAAGRVGQVLPFGWGTETPGLIEAALIGR